MAHIFFKTFDAKDKCKSTILTSYINASGQTINLNDNTNNTRPLKYWPDAAAIDGCGSNIQIIHYADILLTGNGC